VSEWQPIDTAPKNQHFLCGHAEKRWIRFGIYFSSHGTWYYSGTSERSQFAQTRGDEPTHWMPLPEPPK
jgi:hypothetical protein